MTRLTITLTDDQVDVLDAIALADGLGRRSTVVRQLVAHACVTALRERDDVAFLVGLRREYDVEAQARPLASVTPLRSVG